jgi:hypothetical protein
MSQENVEIARRGIEQFNRDFTSTEELDFEYLAPDVVFDNSNAGLDAAVYRGHDGMRELMSLLRGKIAHMKSFQSRADALEAVGLSGQDAHADS